MVEDEATPDPDRVVWEVGEVGSQSMETSTDSDDDEDAHHVLDFDVGDWVDPEASRLRHGEFGKDVPPRGCGSDQMDEESLSVTQGDTAVEHANRVRSLRNDQDIVKDVGGAWGRLSTIR